MGYGFDGFLVWQHGPHVTRTRIDARVGAQTTLYPKITAGLVALDDVQTAGNAFAVSAGLVTVDDAGTVTARKPALTFRNIYRSGLAVLWS